MFINNIFHKHNNFPLFNQLTSYLILMYKIIIHKLQQSQLNLASKTSKLIINNFSFDSWTIIKKKYQS